MSGHILDLLDVVFQILVLTVNLTAYRIAGIFRKEIAAANKKVLWHNAFSTLKNRSIGCKSLDTVKFPKYNIQMDGKRFLIFLLHPLLSQNQKFCGSERIDIIILRMSES